MQQAVEPAITFLDGRGDGFVVRRQRAFEIERHDAGLGRRPSCGDFRVHGFEFAHGAAEQDHFGAGAGQRERHGAADAGTRARDHDDAAAQFIGGRRVPARIESGRFMSQDVFGVVSAGFVGFQRGRRRQGAHRLLDRIHGFDGAHRWWRPAR